MKKPWVAANELDSGIVVSEFEFHSRYYVSYPVEKYDHPYPHQLRVK